MGARTLTLQDKVTSPTIELLLPIDEEMGREPKLLWQESRASSVPARQSEGAFDAAQNDPRIDFVFSQDDWHGGALQPYYRPGGRGYAISDKVDLRWEGVAALGPLLTAATAAMRPYIPNAGAEQNTTTGWTAGPNTTLTAATTAPQSGAYHFNSAIGAELGEDAAIMTLDGTVPSGAIANYQGKSVTVTCWARKTDATLATFRLRISDGTGSTTGASVTLTTSYQQLTVTRTIDAAATSVTIRMLAGTSNTPIPQTLYIDTFEISASTVTINLPGAGVPTAIVSHSDGNVWAIFDKVVAYWTGTLWQPEFASADAAMSDLVSYNAKLYAAGGYSRKYVYKDAAGATTWTGSTDVAPDDKAGYWAAGRDYNGDPVLWKSETATAVANTASPENGGGAWTAPVTVGDTSADINKLYYFADALLIGKEDGLYEFQRYFAFQTVTTDESGFKNVAADWRVNPSTSNFKGGIEWHGWLYLPVQPYGLVRYKPGILEDISRLFRAPRTSRMGAAVKVMAADPVNLWVVVREPAASTFRLFTINEEADELHPHTIEALTLDTADVMAIANNTGYLLGTSGSDGKQYTWSLPTNSVAPYADTTPSIAASGFFETSVFLGGTFDPKALLALDIWGEDLDANHTIQVQYGLEGAATTTETLATYNGAGRIQTKFFEGMSSGEPETDAQGRFVQLRFTFVTNNTTSPKMYGFSLHQVLRPERTRTWEVWVKVGQAMRSEQGRPVPVSLTTLLANLSTLEVQTYPAVMVYDLDGDTVAENTRVFVTVGRNKTNPETAEESVRLLLQEANTA